MIGFICVCFVIAMIFLGVEFIDWRMMHKNWPRIKFKDFAKFHALNDRRWILGEDYVKCILDEDECEGFEFSFIDYCKYKCWRRKIDSRKRNEDNIKSIQRMMDAVKEDIDAAKAKENTNQVTAFKILEDLRKMNMADECPSLVELLKKYDME